ncbi:MAG: response regulator [Bryobacterales bacterium]|jgi:CheY-like chemotaxis protein|nr:response regulator [Bryobacterales bacterium]
MSHLPINVLIVEDNDADVQLTLTALRDARIANEVHVVGDGEEALAFLKHRGDYAAAPHPDLILLDLNLPGKDGFQVLEEMKADPELKTIPVIVVSGSDRESDITRAYSLQSSAYLVKPVDVDEYFTAIRAVKELWFHMVAPPPRETETPV